MDRGCGLYVHEADKESEDELEGRKWVGGLYPGRREWAGDRLGFASKDQIQQTGPSFSINTKPEVDLLLELLPAQSESE